MFAKPYRFPLCRYCSNTFFDESGFPVYKRTKSGITVDVRKAKLDNQLVVPYNRDLLVKYQCHINIEICSHAWSVKYLFKYCLKGPDHATVEVRGRRKSNMNSKDDPVDEIQQYFDGRYICGAEAAYRIFGFEIHHRTISVERLPFHLPGDKMVVFRANDPLPRVIQREKDRRSKLEAFFILTLLIPMHVNILMMKYLSTMFGMIKIGNDVCDRKASKLED